MIDTVLLVILFIFVFFLGIELGAGAVEYDIVEKEGKNHEQKKE